MEHVEKKSRATVGPTERQKEIIECVQKYTEFHNRPPTQIEIAIKLEISQKAVNDQLHRMKHKGLVAWERKPRTLRIL